MVTQISADDAIEAVANRSVVSVDRQVSLRQAAEIMTDESVGVLVVNGYHPPAIVSERDIVRALAEGCRPDTDRVESVMTLDVAFASRRTPIAEVARIMLDNEIRHVPVVDKGTVVTVASARDVMAALLPVGSR